MRETVNLVDLFNFAEECERNKFNYKLGEDSTKIDFGGKAWKHGYQLSVEYSVICVTEVIVEEVSVGTVSLFCPWRIIILPRAKLFNGSIVCPD